MSNPVNSNTAPPGCGESSNHNVISNLEAMVSRVIEGRHDGACVIESPPKRFVCLWSLTKNHFVIRDVRNNCAEVAVFPREQEKEAFEVQAEFNSRKPCAAECYSFDSTRMEPCELSGAYRPDEGDWLCDRHASEGK